MEGHNSSTNVLIVDDEVMILTLCRVMLERQGFTVCTAPNGSEAIAICKRGDPPLHCAIIDFNMPGLNGRETLLAMRRELPGLPVIIVTGYDGEAMETELLGTGVNAIIQKPFRREVLLATLNDVLDRRL